MQLARLTYPGRRTYYRKLVEMVRSLRIELALSKPEILRCYLDRVPMGNNLMGVETAARLYFGKPAAQLIRRRSRPAGGPGPGPGNPEPLWPAPSPAAAAPGTGAAAPGATGPAQPRRTGGRGRRPRQAPGRPGAGFPASPLRRPTLSTWSWPQLPRRPAARDH